MRQIKFKNKNNLKICEKYVDYIFYNKNYSQNTYLHYHGVIKEFAAFIDPSDIRNISKKDFETFFITKKKDLKISSKNNYIVILKNFLLYCNEFQNTQFDFVDNLQTIKNTYDIKIPFSLNEIKLIFSSFNDDKEVEFVVKLLYYTGIRVSEAINILKEDVNISNHSIKILGKGSKERIIFIPEIILEEVKEKLKVNANFLLEYNNKPIKRQKINVMLNDFAIQRGFNFKIHPHKFRRSLATHLIELDMNIREIQVYLGHKSITSTEKYIKLSQEKLKNRVFEAFNKK